MDYHVNWMQQQYEKLKLFTTNKIIKMLIRLFEAAMHTVCFLSLSDIQCGNRIHCFPSPFPFFSSYPSSWPALYPFEKEGTAFKLRRQFTVRVHQGNRRRDRNRKWGGGQCKTELWELSEDGREST